MFVCLDNCSNFNPRSHEGSDLCVSVPSLTDFVISIHAPTRGATWRGACSIIAWEISIHAPTRGATLPEEYFMGVGTTFQSTLPRGERRVSILQSLYSHKFQSTLPRGERLEYNIKNPLVITISIHAPTRGATVVTGNKQQTTNNISIHAPTRGATTQTGCLNKIIAFQSTLPRGERQDRVTSLLHGPTFQSTLPRGERQDQEVYEQKYNANFNPRSHEGSDN